MTLITKLDYAARFDALARRLKADLESLEMPSLAPFVSHPERKIKLDYDRSRETPLQLSAETGQPCGSLRFKRVLQWIDMIEGALTPGDIDQLQAIVPVTGRRTTLSALYPRALAGRLWEPGRLSELLPYFPARIHLTMTEAGPSSALSFAPVGRSVAVSGGRTLQTIGSADLLEASKLINHHWANFCSKAGPWLTAGGISKLAISGAIGAQPIRGG